MRRGGKTVRESPAGPAREGGATVREGGATVREHPAAVRGGGATVREHPAAVRGGGATVRDRGATVRESPATRSEDRATVRENRATVRDGGVTAREREDGATVREGPATPPPSAGPSQQEQAAGWLPAALAADWRVVEALPARGAEADLYVVAPRRDASDTAGATRRAAKVYRQGIAPKEDVFTHVRAADPAHVVRLEAWGQDAGRWWELMEYVEHGSLRALLEREGPKLPDGLVVDVLRQLNDALAGLHALPLEHRDLKPGNVLVRSRTPLDLVLTDFGISSVMNASVHFTDTARTIRYAPPEAIGSIVSDESTRRSMVVIEHTTWDYWSLGMMLLEMLQGAHPYDGLSEAVISHQLATQNVEELTEGLSDPSWRKLCRGLLRRTPSARWDGAAVSKWIADPNDPSLAIAEENAPPSGEPPTAAIEFDGRSYRTPADLGAALSRDWAKAESFWKRRFPDVRTWVTDGLGLEPLGDALAEIDDADLSLDAQVFNFIYHLAPSAPLRFRDADLSVEGLAALARQAASATGGDARTTFLALYREGILMLAGSLPGREAVAEVRRRWEQTVADHERIRSEMRTRGVTVPEPDDDMLVTLLAASVPGVPVPAALRTAAHRASTADARQCPWFRDLGTPEDMSIAVMSMLPHLQAPAEHGAKLARTAPVRAAVGGIVVGWLFGQQVHWAERGVGFGGEFQYHFNGVVSLALVIVSLAMAVMWYGRGTGGVARWVQDVNERRRQRSRRRRAARGDDGGRRG